MQNNTLVLDIFKQKGSLSLSIFEQAELASTLRHYSQLTVSFKEIEKLSQEVTSLLNRVDKKGATESDLIQNLKKTGQLLWDNLLAKAIKERLKQSQIKDLILSIDEELINIPWELLYSGEDFLCLKFNLGRLVRTKEQTRPAQYRNFSSSYNMLILANPTNDLKSAYLEGIFIKNYFDHKRKELKINFRSTHIDRFYVKKNLRDYDIVHFAGHSEEDLDNPKNSGWVLSDGRFTTGDIYAMAETSPLPTLVFSNACHSAKVTQDSFACAFLFSGVRHYIGAIRRIEDTTSLTFAKEFYTQLISGKSVGECIRFSRMKLIKEQGLSSNSWASYILYGDPHLVLFKAKAKPSIAKSTRIIAWYKKKLHKAFWVIFIISVGLYLFTRLPTINPTTYFMFLKSRDLFLKGKNPEVILWSDRILKNDPLFLAIYPLLADTYQRLGNRKTALKYYFDYARSSEKRHNYKHLTQAYIGIGWIYHLQGDYHRAVDFYHKAIALAQENKDRLNEAVALRKLAVWHMDREDFDKALELLLKSSELNRERQYSSEHRYNLACDYFDMGLIFANKDDFQTAGEFYQKSQRQFEKLKLKNELSDCYFNLGEMYLFEKQYQKALNYYLKGLKIDQAQDNKPNLASDYEMLGELYMDMGNLEEAERFFKQSIAISQQIDAKLELASVSYNLGILYKKLGQKDKAKAYLVQAEEVYRQIDTSDYQIVKQALLELDKSP